jgi:hypothetical protein
MSTVLSCKDGVIAKKRHHCCFCFESINPGEKYDKRSGVNDGDIWTMHMHPECHTFEPEVMHADDYEDMSDRSFTRAEAIAWNHAHEGGKPHES